LESAIEWLVNVTGDERNTGDQDDIPLEHHEELQPSRLPEKIHPGENLEEVIQEIRELMLKSTEEVVSKEKMDIGEPV
jgi:hypothetical protein